MAAKDIPWLEIKTEYIDENLDKVIDYLSAQHASSQPDQIYDMTCGLLEKRVQDLLLALSTTAIDEAVNKETCLHNLRILGSFVLCHGDRTVTTVREAFFYFNRLLIELVPDSYTEDLCEIAINNITQNGILILAFNWDDMKTPNLEAIAIKIIKGATFSPEYSQLSWFENKGSLKVENGTIELFEKNRDNSAFKKFSSSLGIMDDRIRVQTEASDRIAQSKEDDVDVMESFSLSVMRGQAKTVPSPPKQLKQYQEGEKVIVKYTRQDFMGGMRVETLDNEYEKISGLIPCNSPVYLKFYNVQQVGCHLSPGCCFEAIYKGERTFDISESFTASLIRNTIKVGEEVNAVLKSEKNGLMTWWTEFGYPAYVGGIYNPGTYQVGDTAYLEITSCASNAYVKAKIIEPSNQTVDENDSRSYCIDGFPLEEEPFFSSAPKEGKVSPIYIPGLCRLLFRYQHCLGDASERYRVLSICRILATMIEDSSALQYLKLATDYLHNLVRFAKNETDKIELLRPEKELSSLTAVSNWDAIIKVLMAYGKEDSEEMLSEVIEREGESPLIVKLAKLIQSTNRIDDVYPAIKNVIRNEITKILAVETVDNADFEKATGPNLGIENSRTEFKTSFFYPPKDAEEQNQEKNVFRDLCSFLNTKEGGVLYLGVNDGGGISGLKEDLKYLEKKVVGGNYKGTDGYIRYIQDRARLYFDLDVRLHFHFCTAYDEAIVYIQVDPYDQGVVEFEGIPYIRNNQESVKLGPADRRKLELRHRQSIDNKSKIEVALAEAIREEYKVIFHGYASSSKNEPGDRNVEPFAFLGGFSYIWCYDLDENKNKLFRISRISHIEITKEKWTEKQSHKKGKTDIFHFSGEKPIPVQLQLDLLARNLLIEEYPDSVTELSPMGNNLWLLNTNIYQIVGLARFYVGLANHITIIDAPELMEYVNVYLEENFKALQ